jgi:Peptidase S46
VVNKANEFVGIIFDGNIQSLVTDVIYTDKQARAVSVDSAAVMEALRKVYGAHRWWTSSSAPTSPKERQISAAENRISVGRPTRSVVVTSRFRGR